MNYYTFAILLL